MIFVGNASKENKFCGKCNFRKCLLWQMNVYQMVFVGNVSLGNYGFVGNVSLGNYGFVGSLSWGNHGFVGNLS